MMTSILTRSTVVDLQIRSGGDGRTIEGRAVPYGVDQIIDDRLTESFRMGAFAHQIRAANRVKLSRGHISSGGAVIGRGATLEERDDGLYGSWLVSATPMGDETLQLVADGVLDELSIGFRAVRSHRRGDGVVVRTRADLVEVAVVIEGAYGRGALVTAVREPTPSPTRLDVAAALLAALPGRGTV
jgi:HK97 family phage prohead protease